ncbi:tetratricopeptide repeat protein [Cyanobium sp. Morenito 9A2]|uniref:tetratricopeptide repeat protein n=1 Tax=Cyanobium sp. Morenito 9A2 TaxID=2823718 RepID=UPI0020CD635B|nr:tetratricopeptide repeat protein [Cyanobium sp. Morenito 9A2]MCP9850311.1 tetratricopeptide repeat protein [Cyanobium sp. Morenito 9A2]
MTPRWLRSMVAAPLAIGLTAGGLVVGTAPAAQALVPYVYIPRSQELEASGLGIAQAATRLLRLGQAEDAAKLAALTVQLLPADPRGWVLLAEAQLRSNQTKEASKALARAKQLDPRNPGILFAQGSLALRDGQPRQAMTYLEQGLKLESKNPGAYFDLGNAHLLLNNPSAALSSFEKAASLRKGFWEAINNQALVLFEMGQTREAIDRWRQALQVKANAAEPTLALAAALQGGGQGEEALRLAKQALGSEPNYVLESYQKEQLWGTKLRAATQRLLGRPELKQAVDRALVNASMGSPEASE